MRQTTFLEPYGVDLSCDPAKDVALGQVSQWLLLHVGHHSSNFGEKSFTEKLLYMPEGEPFPSADEASIVRHSKLLELCMKFVPVGGILIPNLPSMHTRSSATVCAWDASSWKLKLTCAQSTKEKASSTFRCIGLMPWSEIMTGGRGVGGISSTGIHVVHCMMHFKMR